MMKKIIFIIVFVVFLIIYLGSMKRSPVVLFMLTKSEVKDHKNRVLKCNDQNSVRRLAGYYEYVAKDEAEAQYWYNKKGKETEKCHENRKTKGVRFD